jgi:hypothetical protein
MSCCPAPVWAPDTLASISRDAIERFLRDVYDRDLRRDTFMMRITSFEHSTSLKNQLMTLAEQFREEGCKAGRQEGKNEGLMSAMHAAVLRGAGDPARRGAVRHRGPGYRDRIAGNVESAA